MCNRKKRITTEQKKKCICYSKTSYLRTSWDRQLYSNISRLCFYRMCQLHAVRHLWHSMLWGHWCKRSYTVGWTTAMLYWQKSSRRSEKKAAIGTEYCNSFSVRSMIMGPYHSNPTQPLLATGAAGYCQFVWKLEMAGNGFLESHSFLLPCLPIPNTDLFPFPCRYIRWSIYTHNYMCFWVLNNSITHAQY